MPFIRRPGAWLALSLLPALSPAADSVHLLGFVERLCPGGPGEYRASYIWIGD